MWATDHPTDEPIASRPMSLRLPRWTALLVLPLLVGALLLMHGLDANAGASPVDAAMAHSLIEASPHSHDHPASAGNADRDCDHCTAGHLMAACAAVIATVGAVRLRRSAGLGRLLTVLRRAATGPLPALRDVIHPPEPAWVRLSVMLR